MTMSLVPMGTVVLDIGEHAVKLTPDVAVCLVLDEL